MGSSSRDGKSRARKRRGFLKKSTTESSKLHHRVEYRSGKPRESEATINLNKSSSSMKLDISDDEEELGEVSGFNMIINSDILVNQKRCRTRLRKFKETYRGKVLSDGKKLFGKGRLTQYSTEETSSKWGFW